jgi:ribosomal protein RSM22 (predicted rRNA methylase)
MKGSPNFPKSLQDALAQLLSGMRREDLVRDAQSISLRYREKSGSGSRLLTLQTEAAAYAASRMPATYGAVLGALQKALAAYGQTPKTLLDAGAGTGAAAWAADAVLELSSVLCLEREQAMQSLGQALMRSGSAVLQNAVWLSRDLCTDALNEHAELVILAYVLNEMAGDRRAAAVEKLWAASDRMLLIVEPGTPAGFQNLMEARRILLSAGAHIAAPCPHEGECHMAEGDWCHFACRVQRSQLHRRLKGGEAPYEDEKFAYMAFTRVPGLPVQYRILRHPQVRTGHVMVTVCGKDGIQTRTVSRKEGALYRQMRDSGAGDGV